MWFRCSGLVKLGQAGLGSLGWSQAKLGLVRAFIKSLT